MASETSDVYVVVARTALPGHGGESVEQVAYMTLDPVLAHEYMMRKLHQQDDMAKLSSKPLPQSEFYHVVAQLGQLYSGGVHKLRAQPVLFSSPQMSDRQFAELSLNGSGDSPVYVDMHYDNDTDQEFVYRISSSVPSTKYGEYIKTTRFGRDYAFPDGEGLVNEHNA